MELGIQERRPQEHSFGLSCCDWLPLLAGSEIYSILMYIYLKIKVEELLIVPKDL
jgi:hypothetical protein